MMSFSEHERQKLAALSAGTAQLQTPCAVEFAQRR